MIPGHRLKVLGRSSHCISYRATLENGLFLIVKWLREGVTKLGSHAPGEAHFFLYYISFEVLQVSPMAEVFVLIIYSEDGGVDFTDSVRLTVVEGRSSNCFDTCFHLR